MDHVLLDTCLTCFSGPFACVPSDFRHLEHLGLLRERRPAWRTWHTWCRQQASGAWAGSLGTLGGLALRCPSLRGQGDQTPSALSLRLPFSYGWQLPAHHIYITGSCVAVYVTTGNAPAHHHTAQGQCGRGRFCTRLSFLLAAMQSRHAHATTMHMPQPAPSTCFLRPAHVACGCIIHGSCSVHA